MSDLRLSFEPPVARLVLDGPARRNAMTAAMWGDLPKFCAEIKHHSDIYAVIETRLLVEIAGAAAAKYLLFSGRSVIPGEALSLGLINRCVPDSLLDQEAEGQASEWAKLSRVSIRGAKKAVRAALASRREDVRALVEGAIEGSDFRDGRAAFSEKRSPRFSRNR